MMLRRLSGCFLAISSFLLGMRALAQQPADTPNLRMLKTDLLVVSAHPDDESMMAATMARYADRGKTLSLVVCTHGEGGGNGTGKESGVALGEVREAELRRCTGMLGVRYLYFLNQPDWAYTESVKATLERWGHEETLRRLVRLVRLLRPEVVCTMDPAPVGGQHGHHQAAGRLATEAFDAAADPAAFPELQRDEGLYPWRVRKLYWVSWTGGTLHIPSADLAAGALAQPNSARRYAEIALAAEMNHRSQGFDKFMAQTAGQTAPARPEGFLLVKSRVRTNPDAETDLFDGVAGPDPVAEHDLLAPSVPAPSPAVTVAFQPGPAVRDYRAWLKANHLARLLTRMPAQTPVTIGATSPVVVEVDNGTDKPAEGDLEVRVPTGWTATPSTPHFVAPAHGHTEVTLDVTTPATAREDTYTATLLQKSAAGPAEAVQLLATPQMNVARLAAPLPVDADAGKWERAGVVPVAIPPSNAAQGTVYGPQEASGRFFAGYDESGLQVLVDVIDDTVVTNIAPDDIKAHWRTTSVEICIDPTPRAENTFSTLKLGIFPADTAGHVRAARDADANPGPVDRVEPGIQLASRRTASGYVVEARIPWSALQSGVAPTSGRKLGFNVILYHAGKKDAREGEDVGKSRLAWSFWPGVWGRPMVWGTAVLQ